MFNLFVLFFCLGCDSGFGNELATQLNKLGFKVFATCRDQNAEIAKRLIGKAADPKKMVVIVMDVTKDNEIDSAYETVVKSMTSSESLFGLVNNAGLATATEFEFGTDLSDCKKVIDANLIGMMRVTRKFLPLIRQSKGRIVNVESLSGLVPLPFSIFYAVSKAGTVGFSNNLRFSMYKFGVTVVSILPWLHRTPMTNAAAMTNQLENNFRKSPEEVRKAYGEKFIQRAKKAVKKILDFGKGNSLNAVPNSIVTALTSYEPDSRYIVAPFQWQLLMRMWLWSSEDTFEVISQITAKAFGVSKVYPENEML